MSMHTPAHKQVPQPGEQIPIDFDSEEPLVCPMQGPDETCESCQ